MFKEIADLWDFLGYLLREYKHLKLRLYALDKYLHENFGIDSTDLINDLEQNEIDRLFHE